MHAILALVRIAGGCLFLLVGAVKLLDPAFLYGGLMHALEAAGHPFPFYERFLNGSVENHQLFFTFGVSIGEVLLGISLLLGAYVSLSSVFGAFLLVNIALATDYGQWQHFAAHLAGAVALLLLGRIGAGLTWGLDRWLVHRLPPALVLFPLRRSPPRARAHS